MTFGIDLLGMAKYPKTAIQSYKQGICSGLAVGCFSSTFGDSRLVIDTILATGNCPKVRVHLAWKDNHSFSQADFPSIVAEAKKWKPLIAKYPNVGWYLSGACEHGMSKADSVKLAQLVKQAVPECTYVNAGSSHIKLPGCINEIHGKGAIALDGAFSFSWDGNACVDNDVTSMKDRLGNCELHFMWEPRFNGRWESNDTTPRPLRKGWPDLKLIQSVVKLIATRGDVSLPPGWIYKSHSENKGTGDPRAEKPVMICPVKADAIVLKKAGIVVATLPFYGPYIGGGYRYYATKWGFEIGDVPVSVWAGGKKCGVINTCFRSGSYHD